MATGLHDPFHIRRKLLILSLVSLIGMCVIVLYVFSSMSFTLHDEKRHDIRRLINTGINILDYYHHRELDGTLTPRQARQHAIQTLHIIRHGDDGYIWLNDMQGKIIMHPVQPELDGQNVLDLTDRDGNPVFRDFIRLAQEGGGWNEYYWHKPGHPHAWYPKLSYVAPYRPWGWVIGTGLYLDTARKDIHRDILSVSGIALLTLIILVAVTLWLSRRFLHQLEAVAVRDVLTRLYTRRYLFETAPILLAEHSRNRRAQLAAIFFDVDHFKQINDTHGHACGDEVLRTIGQTLGRSVRDTDIAARYGGEELVLLMFCDHRGDARQTAERIRAACVRHVRAHEREGLEITLSAGIAFHREGETLTRLLQRADANLYRAKEQGRNRVVTE